MSFDQLMPPMHADTIRACGVGFRAHHFLHQHMGARPVVVVEADESAECRCCGNELAPGERVLTFQYGTAAAGGQTAYLHAQHCSRSLALAA